MSDKDLKYIGLQNSKVIIDNRLKEIAELNSQYVLSRELRKERRNLRIQREVLSLQIVIEGAKQGLFKLER